MDGELHRLMCLDQMALRYGCGLKPELREHLLGAQLRTEGPVVDLNAPQKSAGPAHQSVTQADLDAQGIPRIMPARARPHQKGPLYGG